MSVKGEALARGSDVMCMARVLGNGKRPTHVCERKAVCMVVRPANAVCGEYRTAYCAQHAKARQVEF